MSDIFSGSHFDSLPPEVVTHLLQFLSPRDVLNLAEADERVEAIVKSSPRVLTRLQFNWSFFVRLEDRPFYFTNKRLCDFNVQFATPGQDRLTIVADLVTRIPTGGRLFLPGGQLIVIIADPEDAQDLYRLFRERGEQVYLSFGYLPHHVSCQVQSTKTRFLLILQKLEANFRWCKMAAIVNVKEPSTCDDFDEVLSYLPRRVFQFVNSSVDAFNLCKQFSAVLKDAGPVPEKARLVNRQFHLYRRHELNK